VTIAEAQTYGPIGARLREELTQVDLKEFATRFLSVTFTWRLSGMAVIANDPGLIGRIRGSFGDLLLAGGSRDVAEGRPCPWNPPCAAEVLWRKQGRMTKGTDLPSPWLIAIDPRRGDLDVSLTLFGFACDYAAAAAEAMTIALTTRVNWAGSSGLFLPSPRVLGRRMEIREGLDLAPPQMTAVLLDFLTPATLTKGSPLDDPAPLFSTLPLRLAGLARWHGLDLALDGLPHVGTLFEQLELGWSDASDVAWTRGSKRQDREIPMRGIVGRLVLAGETAALRSLWPLLAFGRIAHVGADVAFGCGRFDLRVVEEAGLAGRFQ
jgi:hypothetical protein